MERTSGQPLEPAVEVELALPAVAVVRVRGEHDVTTKPQLEAALTEASVVPHVLIDLSECSFLDSSVVTLVMQASEQLQDKRVRVEVVIPPEAALAQRVAKLTQLEAFVPIHESRSAALARLSTGKHDVRVRDRSASARLGEAESYKSERSCGWTGPVQSDARLAKADGARHAEEQRI